MARPRKDYSVGSEVSSVSLDFSDSIVRFPHAGGGNPQVLDFRVYSRRAGIVKSFAEAFYQHNLTNVPCTRYGVFRRLKYFFDFLDAYDGDREILIVSDISTPVVKEYIAWIARRPKWSVGTKSSTWNATKQLLQWMKRRRPNSVCEDLDLPFNPFPNRNLQAERRDGLSRSELKSVLEACRNEIDRSWKKFCLGQEYISCEKSTLGLQITDLDLSRRAVVVRALHDRYGSFLPTAAELSKKGAGLTPLLRAVNREGGIVELSEYFHMTIDGLVPYMIAIAAQLFANPEGLRMIERDCSKEHLFLEGRSIITWKKGRAGKDQQRTFMRGKDMSPPQFNRPSSSDDCNTR